MQFKSHRGDVPYSQDFFQSLGKSGCYFLCLCNAAWRETSSPRTFLEFVVWEAVRALREGYIRDDFYVINPIKVLRSAGLHKFTTVKKRLPPLAISSNQLVIAEYKKGDLSHFAEVGALNKVVFDPLLKGESFTQSSLLVSYRVFS